MEHVVSYAALALPVLVFVALSVTVRLRSGAAKAANWIALALGLLVCGYAALSFLLPALNPTNPDILLAPFIFSASLIAGGVGTLLIVGAFGAAARFRTVKNRRLAQPPSAV